MLVEGVVRECDFTGAQYQSAVKGAWMVAQGNTGRWCTVMHVGPEYLRDNNLLGEILTVDQAERQVDLEGGWLEI